MNQVATQPQAERRATPVESFAAQVMGDEARRNDLFRALPSHIPPARFQRNLFNLLMQKPEILQYDPRLVFREVSKAAALGLSLDPQFAEADIVPVWNSAARRREPELRPRYKGLMKLARQSGEVADIYPGEVRESDHWLEEQGTERRLEHSIDRRNPRGQPFCYYAVVVYKDGTKDFEVMDMEEIHAIREKSDGWRAFQASKIKTTPWSTDEGEMCKKTVLKRLLKRVPQSSDLSEALALDHDREPITNVIDIPRVSQVQPKSIEQRLDAFAGTEADIIDDSSADAGTPPAEATEAAAAQPASGESAPADATPAGADSAPMPDSIRDAMEKGRAGRRSGHGREVPRTLRYTSKQAEADAFLRGWDEEDLEIRAEEAGTV